MSRSVASRDTNRFMEAGEINLKIMVNFVF